jgi:UDP-GlcNAc:undecaprenyl-phosphate GlcNAc-1-phosphate transferase
LTAAVIFVAFGMQIEFVTNPWGGMFYLGAWGIPLTILWLVAMSNVVNFLDGLDGLAAGVSVIAASAVFIVALMRGQYLVAGLTMALVGSSVGFLRYNFNPARIFMGDSGSMFLGFALAAIAVQGSLKGAMTLGLVVPALAFGVPIADTAFAIIRRKKNGVPISQADRGHFHHRLLDQGFSQKQAVMHIYLLTACLALAGVGLAADSALMIWGAVLLGALVLHFGKRLHHLEG